MRRCKPLITTNKRKEGVEVPYIVHDGEWSMVSGELGLPALNILIE
ncbi:MAG: hypothetical protein IPK31_13730 [Chitinophagaceae bacterium]|nr:hypothetical protein [Chitinophagaceae bacterium]